MGHGLYRDFAQLENRRGRGRAFIGPGNDGRTPRARRTRRRVGRRGRQRGNRGEYGFRGGTRVRCGRWPGRRRLGDGRRQCRGGCVCWNIRLGWAHSHWACCCCRTRQLRRRGRCCGREGLRRRRSLRRRLCGERGLKWLRQPASGAGDEHEAHQSGETCSTFTFMTHTGQFNSCLGTPLPESHRKGSGQQTKKQGRR